MFNSIPEIGIVEMNIHFVFLIDCICDLPNVYNLLMIQLFS